MYGRVCMCCGKTEEHGIGIEADHVFPRKLFPNYKNSFANYQILCDVCNAIKGADFIKDYRYEPKNWERYNNDTKQYLESIRDKIDNWWRIHLLPPKRRVKKNYKKTREGAGTIVKPRWECGEITKPRPLKGELL